jgi:hypothetical protein
MIELITDYGKETDGNLVPENGNSIGKFMKYLQKLSIIIIAIPLLISILFIANAVNVNDYGEKRANDLSSDLGAINNATDLGSCQTCSETLHFSDESKEADGIMPMQKTISPTFIDNKSMAYEGIVLAPTQAPMSPMSSELLSAHNRYREEVGVLPMIWSDTLATHAQQWANYLASIDSLQHSSGTGEGENLWAGYPSHYFTYTQMVDYWGAEKRYFINGVFPYVSTTGNWQDVGHYTQMIWQNTLQCGCGLATSATNWDYLVCRYNPPGNAIGQTVYNIDYHWNDLGGYMTSSPFMITDSQGRIHIFVRGSDNALWDNVDATWQGLGGYITSNPFAIRDDQGRIHIFVRGNNGALLDRVIGGSWISLGGYITSNPSAVLAPNGDHLEIFVKGSDNALWMNAFDPGALTGSWSRLGGVITSDPYAIYDSQGTMHVFVRGNEGALWENTNRNWLNRGGYITSGAKPVFDPKESIIDTFVRGSEGSLWKYVVNVGWVRLGGSIPPESSSSPYKATPEPIVDANGDIRSFVSGSEDSLWFNLNGRWYSRGGVISSDPSAVLDSTANSLRIAVRGSDGKLWLCTTK